MITKMGNLRARPTSIIVGLVIFLLLYHTSVNLQLSTLESNQIISYETLQHDDAACEALVDAMDSRYDRQQANRQAVAKKIRRRDQTGKNKFDIYEPEAVCFTEERFGSNERFSAFGDGPKFVCGLDFLDPKDCLVYSIGSNNKIEFEKSIKEFVGCEIHTFDPTLREAFVGGEYATFHPWALGADGQVMQFNGIDRNITGKSLVTIVSELNHTGRKIDILKIDCEGCEWEVMPVVFDAVLNGTMHIDQIQIELHDTDATFINALFQAADRANFRIFHKERNHWGWTCKGYKCVEYAFVSASFLRRVNSAFACKQKWNRNAD